MFFFDCTQFISIKTQDSSNDFIDLIKCYKELDFEIVNESGIKPQKLNYLKSYLENLTVELERDQFLGVFDDWKDRAKVPYEIAKFINITKGIMNNVLMLGETF